MEIWVAHPDIRSEIRLNGTELLKLAFGQPGAAIQCTSGTLWLTQPGDAHDHILKAGQTFRLYQSGTILVQGLPRGRARVIEGDSETRRTPAATQGGNRWKRFFKPCAP
jgi:hypothetical protein